MLTVSHAGCPIVCLLEDVQDRSYGDTWPHLRGRRHHGGSIVEPRERYALVRARRVRRLPRPERPS